MSEGATMALVPIVLILAAIIIGVVMGTGK